MEIFYELARIFSEDNNQWAQRELLIKEGTAKFADTVGQNDRHLQKVIQRQLHNCGVSGIIITLLVPTYRTYSYEYISLSKLNRNYGNKNKHRKTRFHR